MNRNNDPLMEYLRDHGFPKGLAESFVKENQSILRRIWLVDNSYSMGESGGCRIIEFDDEDEDHEVIKSQCSKWEELRQCIEYHTELAGYMSSSSSFRLLNKPRCDSNRHRSTMEQRLSIDMTPEKNLRLQEGALPQRFSIAETGDSFLEDMHTARTIMQECDPAGLTPLTQHLKDIQDEIEELGPRLNSEDKKVVVILATDGLPTDDKGSLLPDSKNSFVQVLQSFHSLRVWIVVRLCTSKTYVTEYYNALDNQAEISMEVLDDFFSECEEVHRCNPWLNYALPLHRCREMGFTHRLFDLIDERKLTIDEMFEFVKLLFGEEEIPDPMQNFSFFLEFMEALVNTEKRLYNPVRDGLMPWIDVDELDTLYAPEKPIRERHLPNGEPSRQRRTMFAMTHPSRREEHNLSRCRIKNCRCSIL